MLVRLETRSREVGSSQSAHRVPTECPQSAHRVHQVPPESTMELIRRSCSTKTISFCFGYIRFVRTMFIWSRVASIQHGSSIRTRLSPSVGPPISFELGCRPLSGHNPSCRPKLRQCGRHITACHLHGGYKLLCRPKCTFNSVSSPGSWSCQSVSCKMVQNALTDRLLVTLGLEAIVRICPASSLIVRNRASTTII